MISQLNPTQLKSLLYNVNIVPVENIFFHPESYTFILFRKDYFLVKSRKVKNDELLLLFFKT